ncbi:MAG TPA: oligosaccharide flippase family protein [Gemmatimonadales bacterium]
MVVRPIETGEAVVQPGLFLGLAARLRALPVLRRTVLAIGGNVAGAAASFLTQMLLARSLAATRYGVYSYVLAWVNFAVLLSKLEFDSAALRYVAAYEGTGRDGLLAGFLRFGWRAVAWTAGSIALIGGSVAWLWRAHLPAGASDTILAAMVLMPLTALLSYSSSILQGLRRVPQAQLPQAVLRPVLFGAALLVMVSVLNRQPSAGSAVALNAFATVIAFGLSLFLVARAVPRAVKNAALMFEPKAWMSTVRGLMIIALGQLVLSYQTDVLVVGTLLGARDAGLYSAASGLTAVLALAANGISFVVFPIISQLSARGSHHELQRLVVRTVQGSMAVTIPAAILLCAAGPLVLHWYGPSFAGAAPVLFLLTAGWVAGLTVGGLASFLLIASGHERIASRVAIFIAAFNLTLSLILTPLFGLVGAAVATMAAAWIRAGLLYWYASRTLNVAVLPFLPRERSTAAKA